LSLGLGEVVFGSAILFVNRIVGLDGHARKRIAAFRNLVADRKIIPDVHGARQQSCDANNAEECVFQPFPSLNLARGNVKRSVCHRAAEPCSACTGEDVGGPVLSAFRTNIFRTETENLAPWYWQWRCATRQLSLIEDRVCSHVRWLGSQHLLFAVDQVAGVKARNFEAVAVSDRIRGTSLDTVSAENTSIVVYVIDLGVALRPAHSMLGGVLRRLDIDAVGGAGRRAQETGYTLFQSVLIALQDVHSAKTLLELGAP